MKNLFIYLLKEFTRNEKGRIEVLRVLDEQIKNEYTEQTGLGNVYNLFSEFLLANSVAKGLALKNEEAYLTMLKNGINTTFDETITMIKNNG